MTECLHGLYSGSILHLLTRYGMATGIYYRAVCFRSMVAIDFKPITVDELL